MMNEFSQHRLVVLKCCIKAIEAKASQVLVGAVKYTASLSEIACHMDDEYEVTKEDSDEMFRILDQHVVPGIGTEL